VVGCWHGYLSGARCRFAYRPADATATHYLLLQKIQIGFTRMVLLFWCRLTRVVLEKRPLNECSVVVVIQQGTVDLQLLLPFYDPLSGTTRECRYQKEYSPTHTHRDHQSFPICLSHPSWSTAIPLLPLNWYICKFIHFSGQKQTDNDRNNDNIIVIICLLSVLKDE